MKKIYQTCMVTLLAAILTQFYQTSILLLNGRLAL